MKPFIIMSSVLLAACAYFNDRSIADTGGAPKRLLWASLVGAEIVVSLVIGFHWHAAIWPLTGLQVIQSGVHVYKWYHNEKTLVPTAKK